MQSAFRSLCVCGALLAPTGISAAAPPEAQPTAPAVPAQAASSASSGAAQAAPLPDAARCFPSCREGFVCHGGQCVSWCNPPCASGEVCVGGSRCEFNAQRAAAPGVYEPPPPILEQFEVLSHSMLGFHLGFAGDVERDGAKEELVSTLGFNFRSDVPVQRYLLLGPLIQVGAWRADVDPAPSRNYYIDLDFYLRARIPIVTETFNFQVWAGVPIGLTLDMLGEEVPDASGLAFGWNVGALFGASIHFTRKFGLFAELGWLQHKMSHSGDVRPDLDFRLGQWNMNLGFVFRK